MVGFSFSQVSIFISVVCVTTVIAQTVVLPRMMSWFGYKYTIIIGLVTQAMQLAIYGIWSTKWFVFLRPPRGLFVGLSLSLCVFWLLCVRLLVYVFLSLCWSVCLSETVGLSLSLCLLGALCPSIGICFPLSLLVCCSVCVPISLSLC